MCFLFFLVGQISPVFLGGCKSTSSLISSVFLWVNSACLWSALVSAWFFACLVGGDWNRGEMYGIMMVNDG